MYVVDFLTPGESMCFRPICIPAGVRPTADSHAHVGIGGCSTRGQHAPGLRSVDDDGPLRDLPPFFLTPS